MDKKSKAIGRCWKETVRRLRREHTAARLPTIGMWGEELGRWSEVDYILRQDLSQ